MWWYGRGNSGGSWLPEEKKANMWPGKGNSGGSWPPAFPRSLSRGAINHQSTNHLTNQSTNHLITDGPLKFQQIYS